MRMILVTAFLATASMVQADGLFVQFADGAPKDTLTLRNDGCALTDATLVIDLRGTAAGLIFDVTAAGAGVDVFQPIQTTKGKVVISPVADGGQVLHLFIPSFASGETIRLTADLDDTAPGRQITVTGAEMAGATVSVANDSLMATAPFDANASANLTLPPTSDGCLAT